MVIIAEPIQRTTLRKIACVVREWARCKNELYFPIMPFLEHKMPLLFAGFHHEVVPKFRTISLPPGNSRFFHLTKRYKKLIRWHLLLY
jgi:hypothetical protein